METKARKHLRLEEALGVIWTQALARGVYYLDWDHIEFAVKHMTGHDCHYGLTLEILVVKWHWMADHTGVYLHAGEPEVCRD